MILGTFFEISTGDMTTMLGYVGGLFSDLAPYLLILFGVGIGLIVITAIISAIRR